MTIRSVIITSLLPVVLLLFFSDNECLSQVSENWVAHYNGEANNAEYARDFEMDQNGNTYIIGTSMNSDGTTDIVTTSFDQQGERRWVSRYDGADDLNDWGYSIAIDSSSNVVVCGSSQSGETGKDFVIIKYNSGGDEIWARYYNGPADRDDEAVQVEVDCSGNVAATGSSQSSGGVSDYATVKFDADGGFLWAARYNGPGDNVDEARALAVDCDGNVFVSGGSIGDGTDYDYATIKYDSDGNEQWIRRYDGPAHMYDVVYYAGSILLDTNDNIYLTGYSTGEDSTYDYYTIKYDSDGNLLWSDRYSGGQGNDYADRPFLDNSGNLYITGASYNSVSNYDYLTIKYSQAGNIAWSASYNGEASDWDEAYGLDVDTEGNVYVLGRSVGANTMADFATVKYSPDGQELWSIRYDGSAHNFDWPFKLLLDDEANVYVAGSSMESGSASDYTIIKYEQIQSGIDDGETAPGQLESLLPNYPNPFNSRTEIGYYLPKAEHIQLSIFDILGRLVEVLVDSEQNIGFHHVVWDSRDSGSGLYFYRLETENSIQSRSMIIIK